MDLIFVLHKGLFENPSFSLAGLDVRASGELPHLGRDTCVQIPHQEPCDHIGIGTKHFFQWLETSTASEASCNQVTAERCLHCGRLPDSCPHAQLPKQRPFASIAGVNI